MPVLWRNLFVSDDSAIVNAIGSAAAKDAVIGKAAVGNPAVWNTDDPLKMNHIPQFTMPQMNFVNFVSSVYSSSFDDSSFEDDCPASSL